MITLIHTYNEGFEPNKNAVFFPENGKHPRNQNAYMRRLADIEHDVIIQTNSDHILNGLLVCIKEGIISPLNVTIIYYDENNVGHEIFVLKGGKLSSQPKGFFDQIQIDLKNLIGF